MNRRDRTALRSILSTLLLTASLLPIDSGEAQGTPAPAPPGIPLWPTRAPGFLGGGPEDRPSYTVHLPPDSIATGAAMVVLPGGGYRNLAMDHEGAQVARWLNSIGVAAFVVKYRLGPRYRHPTMLNDAQRALRTVRAGATRWKLDPARIGILGFSAGGHLASTAGTHFDAGRAEGDPIERVSSRPDFMVLVYPVITMAERYTHRGSRTNLLGEAADPALVALLSSETQVTASTPPTFLVHSTDDAGVPVENSLLFFQALRAAGVPAEMHVYRTGRHGFGLGAASPSLATWPHLAELWMRDLKILTRTPL